MKSITEKLDDLIRNKSYDHLSEDEQLLVKSQLGDQDAYKRLQTLVKQFADYPEMEVSPVVKKTLLADFKQRNRSFWIRALAYKVPAYSYLLLVLISMALLWIYRPVERIEVPKMVQLPAVVDTVMIHAPADTVVIEKTIRVPVYLTRQVESATEKSATTKSKTLQDREGLTDLLVSTK